MGNQNEEKVDTLILKENHQKDNIRIQFSPTQDQMDYISKIIAWIRTPFDATVKIGGPQSKSVD